MQPMSSRSPGTSQTYTGSEDPTKPLPGIRRTISPSRRRTLGTWSLDMMLCLRIYSRRQPLRVAPSPRDQPCRLVRVGSTLQVPHIVTRQLRRRWHREPRPRAAGGLAQRPGQQKEAGERDGAEDLERDDESRDEGTVH